MCDVFRVTHHSIVNNLVCLEYCIWIHIFYGNIVYIQTHVCMQPIIIKLNKLPRSPCFMTWANFIFPSRLHYLTPMYTHFETLYVTIRPSLHQFNQPEVTQLVIAHECQTPFLYENSGLPPLLMSTWPTIMQVQSLMLFLGKLTLQQPSSIKASSIMLGDLLQSWSHGGPLGK